MPRSLLSGTAAILRYAYLLSWQTSFLSLSVRGDRDDFTYFDENTDRGRGVDNWSAVDDAYRYFPWQHHLRVDDENNCGSSFRQSPINVKDWKGCGSADNDDNHRHWTVHGDCTLHDVSFTIEKWGLLMTYPFVPGTNPEMSPCMHPMMDSSGGYGAAFFANYVSVVSPAEHQIEDETFDAEVNIAHFNYGTKTSMIFSILCRAKPEYPDNVMLEPYLREWERVHANNRQKCESHMKHCPVTAKMLETGNLDSQTTGSSRDASGMMFDMKARFYDVAIKAFDVNVSNGSTEDHQFKVFVRQGSHVGYEKSASSWTEISDVHVYGNGKDEKSRLMLDVPYLLKRGVVYGFYIFQTNDNDLQNADIGRSTGSEHTSTSDLTLYVGTAVGSSSGSYDPFTGSTSDDRAFAGNVYYARCDLPTSGSESSYTMSAHHSSGNSAGLELTSSIESLSGNGYNFVGCFERGGDHELIYQKTVTTIEACADICRGEGTHFAVIRDGGKCYCTSGEYSYEGHADGCRCSNPSDIGGSAKQCAFKVLASYLGCFKQSRRMDTFDKRVTVNRGLTLQKCEEVCFDSGYRYVGRMWEGLCLCGNSPKYDRYGTTTGCECSAEHVGRAWKFCAFDLGANVPEVVKIKNNPDYSVNKYDYLGCYQDLGDRALPTYIGSEMSDDDCASACYNMDFKFFGLQYKGECYCGNGDYMRHGTSNKCSCNSSNRGGWILCVYGFTKLSRRRELKGLSSLEEDESSTFGNVMTNGINSLWSASSILGGGNSSSINFASIESDGRLRITARRKENERKAAKEFQMSFTNATQLPPFIMDPSTNGTKPVTCNETNVKFTTNTKNVEVVYKKGVMFDLHASGLHQNEEDKKDRDPSFDDKSSSIANTLMNTVAIKGFDLYLSTNFLENGGMMRNIRVFTRPKSLDGLGSWTDLGLYHVISLGPNIPSSLDLHEPFHIPSGEIQTFVIRDVEPPGGSSNTKTRVNDQIIANAIVHGKTFGDVQHQDKHLTLMINPETKPHMNSTLHMTSLSFHGTVHYSLCQKDMSLLDENDYDTIQRNFQEARTRRRRLDGGPRDAEWGPFDWAKYPEFDPYRLLTTPWFFRYRGSFTKPMCYNDVRWRVFKEPMQISMRQKTMIDELIKEMLDTNTCKKSTIGKPRFDGTDYVNVNRPIQRTRSSHDLFICDSDYWKSQGFYNTPRANTNWKLLDDHEMWVPESHFTP